MTALVDSGATGRFIDRNYVKANRLITWTLSIPIPVRNVDGTTNEVLRLQTIMVIVNSLSQEFARFEF